MEDKGSWFKVKDIKTLIVRVSHFFNIGLGHLQDEIIELERLAKIGEACEDAFIYFSMGTVDEKGKEYFTFLDVEDMLKWYKESEGK